MQTSGDAETSGFKQIWDHVFGWISRSSLHVTKFLVLNRLSPPVVIPITVCYADLTFGLLISSILNSVMTLSDLLGVGWYV